MNGDEAKEKWAEEGQQEDEQQEGGGEQGAEEKESKVLSIEAWRGTGRGPRLGASNGQARGNSPTSQG